MRGRFGSSHCCSSMSLICFPLSRQRHQLVADGCWRTDRHRSPHLRLARDVDADAAGLVKAITAPPFAARLVAASCASAMISPSGLSPALFGARDSVSVIEPAGRLAIGAASLS